MKIQRVELETGLDRPSIRYYEKEGLLNPKRLENGYREYSQEDVELLKKIKLLRRLGMGIEKIRQLQQGSADLNAAIAAQVSYHSSQIDDHRRCRAVCEAIRDDGAVFASLDAEHYLRLLREIRIDDRALGKSNFKEDLPKEIHPWKRFIARWLDLLLWSAVIQFILIVIVRMRPLPGDFLNMLLDIGILALFIPVEAFFLHKFGTTPGKYVMGIRVEYIQGGNLPYAEALHRSLSVFVCGEGLGIPFAQLGMNVYRYCQLTGRSWRRFARYDEVEGPQDMPWDEDTELIYGEHNWKRGAAAALILACSISLVVLGTIDGFKPRYRGNNLTVAQVASNYNATMQVLMEDPAYYDKLQEDGSKKPVASNTVIFDMNQSSGGKQMEFSYDVQDGFVRSVSIQHSWDQVFYLTPLNGDPMNMACCLLLAQDGCGIRELDEFVRLYESHLDSKVVSFKYRNLTIEWTITTENQMLQGVIHPENDEDLFVSMDFCITIR